MTGWRDAKAHNAGDIDGFDNTIAAGGAGALNDTALAAMYNYYALRNVLGGNAATAKLWSLVDQFGGGFFVQDGRYKYDQFSEELQLVGEKDRIKYATGIYFFTDDGKFDNVRLAATPFGGVVGSAYNNETTASAIYGQFTWTPPVLDDKLALTVGYRYTRERKKVKYRYLTDRDPSTGLGLLGAGGRINLNYTGDLYHAPTYGDRRSKGFRNNSGGLTVSYQVSDGTNIFARLSTGYKSGGFNGEIYGNQFDEETIKELELGLKSDVVPGVWRLNATLFGYKYQDQQTNQVLLVNNVPTTLVTNAGESKRWGFELETQIAPFDALVLGINYTYIHGDFEKYPSVCGTGTGESTCISTDHYARRGFSPDNYASVTADWVFYRTARADFVAHVDLSWRDKINSAAIWSANYGTAPNTLPYVYEHLVYKEMSLVNARVSMEKVKLWNGALSAALWAKNLFDKDYQATGINFGTLGPIFYQYGEPRTWGVDVTWEF